MTLKKQKEKQRRRARKMAEEAWEAANNHNLQLAEKIIRRAVATQPENPVLWNDQGMVLALNQKDDEAEDAFRTALSLAPDYAEPYAHLAAIQIRQGYTRRAVALQEQAVKFAPRGETKYLDQLASYRALIGHGDDSAAAAPAAIKAPGKPKRDVEPAPAAALRGDLEFWQRRIAALDWCGLTEQLTREGCALVPGLLDADACLDLRSMFSDDAHLAKTVVMDAERFGNGTYRYFQAPLPEIVDCLRRAVYPHVARIANDWQALLNEPERYPFEWEDFRKECAAAGQTTPTPILLRYGPGGFNALHRDLRGRVFFPLQMAVVLSPRAEAADAASEGFRGGDFLFCDVPEGKKSRRREVAAGLGDALLFCTRDRLVRVGGAYGLQAVKHGVAKITEGERTVLGMPFHEYR